MRSPLLALILLCSCSPTSIDDYKKEGESLSWDIVHTLEKIQTREQLVQAAPLLKKKFNLLVDLMIEAKQFSGEFLEDSLEPNRANERLLAEFKRIYALEGGKAIIESAQREPLIRLDGAFQKKPSGYSKKRGRSIDRRG